MTLCDVCLEPTTPDALVDCAEPATGHCGRCTLTCRPCQDATTDDHAVEVAADLALERCER